MRVELTIGGGFAYIPGLAKPIVLDGTHLDGSGLVELRRLCDAVLAAPNRGAEPPSATLPDARRYRLILEIDGEMHEISAADPIGQPAFSELVDFVRAHGGR